MIVLDTNVISELMRPGREPSVVEWIRNNPPGETYVTAVSIAEISYGLARLPDGRRKQELAHFIVESFELFDRFTLPFDSMAASVYGPLVASREAEGRPIDIPDAQIAAICVAHDASLASRNVKDFVGSVESVIDPWATT
ncbi:MAG: type II toxin-antitoxin system VapC family toxin [Actinobacteria bacterium]|nr:type II toxin-antitoxin system VapC family toxin [Actinomycetota bacterium]